MAMNAPHIINPNVSPMIPELWMAEVLMAREMNLVASKVFYEINHRGKKGDVLHLPTLSHLVANDKLPETEVTLQAPTEGEKVFHINKHKEVSFIIEDFTEAQENYELRRRYTEEAGKALARTIDTDILAQYVNLDKVVAGDDGITDWDALIGNSGDITDVAIRNMLELLDNADVPEDNRFVIVPPSQKNVIRGIPKFIEMDKYGSNTPLQKGLFGEIYGLKFYSTTNCPTIVTGNNLHRVGFLGHKESIVALVQKDVRIQAQYLQQFLGTLVTADVIYDDDVIRPDSCIAFVVPK